MRFCPCWSSCGAGAGARVGVLPGSHRTSKGPSPALALQSLSNCIWEPHPNSSRLCQGDWKFLLSSFSGMISTLSSVGGREEEPGRSTGSVFSSSAGVGWGGLLGLPESLRNNNNKQPAPTSDHVLRAYSVPGPVLSGDFQGLMEPSRALARLAQLLTHLTDE